MQSNVFDIEYRVYIAGVLMPSLRVGVSSAFNSPPTATISLPPYAELYGIGRGDRIPVHVFIKESWVEDEAPFILLFEGEITNFSYSSTGMGRELNINAQSLFALLRDVNIQVMTSVEDIVAANVIKGENNQGQHMVRPGMVFPMSLFMKGLGTVEESALIETPTEYLKNAYTFLQEPGKLKKANDSKLAEFYGKYAAQIRLSSRYQELPYFDQIGEVWSTEGEEAGAFPLIDGIQKQSAIQQLYQSSMSAMGSTQGPTTGSVYDLVNYVVSQMEYEFSFICSPRYIPGTDDYKDLLVGTCLKPILYEAVPPACNLIYRPLVQSIQTAEKVYQVPTRIRMVDTKGPIPMMGQPENGLLASWGTIDYYPSEEWVDGNEPDPDSTDNWYAAEVLENEQYTGTYMFETEAPSWLHYVSPKDMGVEDNKELKRRVMEHTLIMKKYQPRRVQVQAAFNPYVVPGFPGAVYDSEDQAFTFVGHVLSVNHSLSKTQCTTSLSLGFSRLIDEAIDDPLENRSATINAVTQDTSKMSDVYQSLLGCSAVDFKEVKAKSLSEEDAQDQTNPSEAYSQVRREVVTFEEYLSFMGLEVADTAVDEDGNNVPTLLTGDFVEKRFEADPVSVLVEQWVEKYGDDEDDIEQKKGSLEGIRWKLKAIADREFKNKVYN